MSMNKPLRPTQLNYLLVYYLIKYTGFFKYLNFVCLNKTFVIVHVIIFISVSIARTRRVCITIHINNTCMYHIHINNTCMYYNVHEQHVYVLQFTWTTHVCTTIYMNNTCMYYNSQKQHVYVLQYTWTARVCTCTTSYINSTCMYYNVHDQHV